MAATRDDWRITPLSSARTSIPLERTYSADEFTRIQEGHVPKEMEDKWFAFYEEPWLYLHRSWTGYGIYQARFEPTNNGVRVAEAIVSRDSEQYKGTDDNSDALLLARLLDRYAGRDTRPARERYRTSHLKIGSIVIRCYEFDRMLEFWQAALGYVPREPAKDGWVVLRDPDANGPNLSLEKVPERRSGKRSRLHLDLYTHDSEREVERLVGLGAARYPWRYPQDADYVVLEDPDGNLFCVVQKE